MIPSLVLAISLIGVLILQVFLPGFPKEVIMFQSGVEFGLVLGSFINWIGMVVGAQIAYEVVRRSVVTGGRFSDILEKYPTLPALQYLRTRGNSGLFVLRLLPNSPNDVLSLISGGLFLPRRGFFLVSMATAIPYAIVFAYFGSIGSEFIDRKTLWLFNIALFVIFLLVISVMYLKHRRTIVSETL